MLKKINISRVFICALAFVLSSICYAETWSYIDTMQCSPSVKKAGWTKIEGVPNEQYTITTIGMEIKGVGLIVDWEGYHEDNEIYDNDTAYVIAKCELSGKETKMYDLKRNSTALPSLSCPKGEGILMRFLSPNDIDPDKYVFKYTMTVVRDDAQVKKIEDNQVEQNIKNNTQLNNRITQFGSSSNSGLGW